VSDEDIVSDLNNAGVRVDAVAVAERKIRSIKERVRCAVNNLPFNLSNEIEDCLFMWAVSRINLAVTSNSSVVYHHQKKDYNQKIDILREGIHGFGDYVQVYSNDANNCLIESTRGAIVALSRRGAWTAAGTTLR
jgi:hypothetical protein